MKIQITDDRKTLIIAVIMLLLIGMLCAVALVFYLCKVASFDTVNATITNIETIYSRNTADSQNRNKYVKYSFVYNTKKYNAKKLILFSYRYKIGEQTAIRINPNNPDEVENNLFKVLYIVAIIICATIIVPVLKRLRG